MDLARANEARYRSAFAETFQIVEAARRLAARSVNSTMTAAHWLIGRRIVEFEQEGEYRAKYGDEIIKRVSLDLTARFGKGFSTRNVQQMKAFYIGWPIAQTLSAQSEFRPQQQNNPEDPEPDRKSQTASAESFLSRIEKRFRLPWSAYVRLLSVTDARARKFYESEAMRRGWTVRQLDLQINSQFYERTILSVNKSADPKQDQQRGRESQLLPDDEFKDPFSIQFLDLKDEFPETDLEEALVLHMRDFLTGLETNIGFVGQKKRLRLGDELLQVDLLLFHRCLRCLVIVDLKCEEFAPFDESQMKLYLNYAKKHWTYIGENSPIGLIVRAQKDNAVVRYVWEGLPDKVATTEYRTVLPEEHILEKEVLRVQQELDFRAMFR